MKEIGGYLSFEFSKNNSVYHNTAFELNTSRNAFEYILVNKKISKVYVPYFNCGVMLEPLLKTSTPYEYYSINLNLEINDDIILRNDEYILYVNYFGIKNRYVEILIEKFGNKLIIDNSQSFFSKFDKNIFSIYSPRKFFGVSDGGYLVGDIKKIPLKKDYSISRLEHLFGRIECGAKDYYKIFNENDNGLINQPILEMSDITKAILRTIDYEIVKSIRNQNFQYLHNNLKNINELYIDIENINGAMVYPFLLNKNIKNTLVSNNIYVATYWSDVLDITNVPKNETYLTRNIIPLPIDQRYTLKDMDTILEIIRENYND